VTFFYGSLCITFQLKLLLHDDTVAIENVPDEKYFWHKPLSYNTMRQRDKQYSSESPRSHQFLEMGNYRRFWCSVPFRFFASRLRFVLIPISNIYVNIRLIWYHSASVDRNIKGILQTEKLGAIYLTWLIGWRREWREPALYTCCIHTQRDASHISCNAQTPCDRFWTGARSR